MTLWTVEEPHSPGSSVHGIPWARILEWVAIPFSRDSSQPRDQTRVTLITGGLFTAEPPGKPKTFILCDNIFSPSQYISFWVCPYDYIKVLQSQPECCRWWCVLPQGTTAGDTYSSLSPCSLALLTPSSIIASFSFFLLAPNKQSVRKHFGPGQISCSLSTFSCQNWHWLVFLAWPTLYSGNSKSAAVLPAAPPH